MSNTYRSYILHERPQGGIIRGQTFQQKVQSIPSEDDLKDGQILVKILYLSLDPAMRVWIDGNRSYTTPVEVGSVMRGGAVCRVLASRSSRFEPGNLIFHLTGWREYAILSEADIRPQLQPLPSNARPSDLLGIFGLTGLTAKIGIEKIADIHKGDVVVVSGAAGATGSIVGQLAKSKGAKVIGITGSDDKCSWLTNEMGFDIALNYKSADFRTRLIAETPDYINVYWDNVGGQVLDLCLERAAPHARFVACGMISQYNVEKGSGSGPPHIMNVVLQRIKFQGFIASDYSHEFPEYLKQLNEALAKGELKRTETIIKGGIESIEDAWFELYKGGNKGKLLLEVSI